MAPRKRYFFSRKAGSWAVFDRVLDLRIARCDYRENANLIVNALNAQELPDVHAPTVYSPTILTAKSPPRDQCAPGRPDGDGEAYSLGTIADAGCELFVLFTENALETLLGYWTDRGLPVPANVHWHLIEPGQTDFTSMAASAEKILTFAQEALHKMADPKRMLHSQFVDMLRALANFPDDRTGERYGPVDHWGPDRCLAISTLSGINPIAMSLVVGGKPVKSQADWGIAMDQVEKLMRQFTNGCKCHFVLEAHVEREIDPTFGGTKITVSTLGSKLAPKIPPMFSDVILSVREGNQFKWSTANPQADLKARNLAIADGLPQDFGPLFAKWKSRGGRFTPKVQQATQESK